MAKKAVNALFLGALLAVLLAGLGRTVFSPKEINSYENRYAETIAPLTVEGWLDGSFQDSVDKALADQVQLSERYKETFNNTSSRYLRAVSNPLMPLFQGRYVYYVDVRLFNGCITYPTYEMESLTERLDAKADNYNECFAAHPELDFYVYYIEKDTDINFETGEKVPARPYLFDQLNLPRNHLSYFSVDGFDDFSAWFYRTDHHWNQDGSYRGYTQLLDLLGVEDAPLAPAEGPVELGAASGSKAIGAAAGFTEPFYAYRYDFPDMDVTVIGDHVDYGAQDAFFAGEGGYLDYGAFYGWDAGEATFSTNRPERENILILGESYDNAILKLLASHFNNTYSVDLRYYETFMGEKFSFSRYVKERGITKVLLIGNIDYFLMDEFRLEG